MESNFIIYSKNGSEPEEMIYAIKSGNAVETRVNCTFKTGLSLLEFIIRSMCQQDKLHRTLFLISVLDIIHKIKESEDIRNG